VNEEWERGKEKGKEREREDICIISFWYVRKVIKYFYQDFIKLISNEIINYFLNFDAN